MSPASDIFSVLVNTLGLRNGDFQNHGLTFRDQRALRAGQLGQERQFHPLHGRLDSAQRMAANQDLMRREDQLELLLLSFALEFGEGELIKRQQQTPFSRHLDFDAVSVRVARPTFG